MTAAPVVQVIVVRKDTNSVVTALVELQGLRVVVSHPLQALTTRGILLTPLSGARPDRRVEVRPTSGQALTAQVAFSSYVVSADKVPLSKLLMSYKSRVNHR